MSKRTLLAVGKIVKAFGVRGDVAILPMTDNSNRFRKLKRVFVGKTDTDAQEAGIASVAVEQRGVRLRLDGISDRTAAEQLVGSLIFIEESDAVHLPKGTYFIHDVVGLNVIDETGNAIGIVKDVLKYPANDVYLIEHDGIETMIPAVKEFITKIDLETRTMKVKLIEGMRGGLEDDVRDNDAD